MTVFDQKIVLKFFHHSGSDPNWIRIQQQPGSGTGTSKIPRSGSRFSDGYETLQPTIKFELLSFEKSDKKVHDEEIPNTYKRCRRISQHCQLLKIWNPRTSDGRGEYYSQFFFLYRYLI